MYEYPFTEFRNVLEYYVYGPYMLAYIRETDTENHSIVRGID
jgi:hypothetical protein